MPKEKCNRSHPSLNANVHNLKNSLWRQWHQLVMLCHDRWEKYLALKIKFPLLLLTILAENYFSDPSPVTTHGIKASKERNILLLYRSGTGGLYDWLLNTVTALQCFMGFDVTIICFFKEVAYNWVELSSFLNCWSYWMGKLCLGQILLLRKSQTSTLITMVFRTIYDWPCLALSLRCSLLQVQKFAVKFYYFFLQKIWNS